MDILSALGNYGLIPVVVLEEAEQAVPLARALSKAGLPVAEITLRTEAGLESIRKIREAMPDFLLGAGTVLTLEQCKAAIEAGASYIVSPGLYLELIEYCKERDVLAVPGCVTPTEIEQALLHDVHTVKFFPASAYGGVSACKALYAPYAAAGVRFIPTGGISADNLADYADKPFIHAIGGGWLTPRDAIAHGDWERITQITREAVDLLLGFELAHVGVNLESEEAALSVAEQFERCFGWRAKNGNSSIFSSTCVEILKAPGRGAMGHLAVRTNSVDRALHYLAKRGMQVDPESVRYRDGKAYFAYMRDQIGGFAVHLLQK